MNEFSLKSSVNRSLRWKAFYEKHRRKHEKAHTKMVRTYAEYQMKSLQEKAKYKACFVIVCLITMSLPPLLMLAISAGLVCGCIHADVWPLLAIVIGNAVSFVASVVVIPKTIAEYCFNKKEDANVRKIFLNAQEHDLQLHENDI